MNNATDIILLVLSTMAALATFTAAFRFLSPKEEERSPISDISDLEGKEISVFAKLEGSGNLWDKVDLFFARSLGQEKKLEETYMLLGSPANTNPLKMLHSKQLLAVLLPVLLFLPSQSLFSFIFMPLGFLLPDAAVYARKIRARQEDILGSFPTFVDLSALMIEAGLDYMTSFSRIVEIAPVKTTLENEVGRTISEVQLGYSRRVALRRLSLRTGLQEVRSFVGLIVQSDELGTSLVELLRNYSGDLRFRRLNRAEQMAAQASTKMLIPLFIFIFPTVFILMLAPMIYDLVTGGGMPF